MKRCRDGKGDHATVAVREMLDGETGGRAQGHALTEKCQLWGRMWEGQGDEIGSRFPGERCRVALHANQRLTCIGRGVPLWNPCGRPPVSPSNMSLTRTVTWSRLEPIATYPRHHCIILRNMSDFHGVLRRVRHGGLLGKFACPHPL